MSSIVTAYLLSRLCSPCVRTGSAISKTTVDVYTFS